MVRYCESLQANPDFDSLFSELVDLTKVVSSEVNFQTATMLARIDPFSHEAKRAFAAPKAAIFGIVRMYQGVRGPESDIAVFESIREATQWLGIKESEEGSADLEHGNGK